MTTSVRVSRPVTAGRSGGIVGIVAACVLCAATAGAQTPAAAQTSSTNAAASSDTATRPATTTFFGDTGLWFVPTGEVLPAGKWSVSGYRRGTNYIEGYTNVGDFAGTFAYGFRNRVEVFGSLIVDTRVARNLQPVFTADPTFGSVVAAYPKVTSSWTGNHLGDLYLGAKVNLWSEYRQNPVALAVRGIVKVPTASVNDGVGTGKADVFADLIVSKELSKTADVSGYAGYGYFGQPGGFSTPTSAFRWGFGAAVPSRSPLRADLELNGMAAGSSSYAIATPVVGIDGTVSPLTSQAENLTRATMALTWQMPDGIFFGGGVSWNVPMQSRTVPTAIGGEMSEIRDYWDWQVRIGFHPGVRVYVPPPPPPAPAPPPVAQNRPPTVTAQCDPCTVQVGQTSTVTATGRDPDGDPLTYRWTAPTGQFQNQAAAQTIWTAPQQVGPVPVTVTVNDGKGGTASDMVTIQVIAPPAIVQLMFEDIYFDFDRSTLRPEALRLLDDAVTKLMANPDKNLIIEGHTCNIGTAEYNLALGDRRAASVRNYLISRGVPAARLETRSFGEEMPKYDNAREETRRLNRRAALVVKVQ